jgi:nucleoside-diphosphate-sugar epimerase
VAISVCEQQADAIARRYSGTRIASLRFHWIIPSRAEGAGKLTSSGPNSDMFSEHSRDLWGWVSLEASARACLLGLTAAESAFHGHEAFFIVAPTTAVDLDSADLQKDIYPEVTDIRKPFKGNSSFFDCSKAERLLGWTETDI